MMKNRIASILFVMAAAATGFGAPHSPEADAATERIPASICYSGTEGALSWRDGISNNSSGLGWSPVQVFCPITDGPSHSRVSITGMNVVGFDGNTQAGSVHDFQAKICITDVRPNRTTHFASCSATASINLGTYTAETFEEPLPASLISHVRDTGMWNWLASLVVQIPAHNGNPSIFYGYKIGW